MSFFDYWWLKNYNENVKKVPIFLSRIVVSVPKSFPAMVFLAVEQLAAVVLVCCCRFQHVFINTNAFILSLDVRVTNHKCLVCIH